MIYKSSKGLTLVELMVVVGIILALAVGGILVFAGVRENAQRTNLINEANQLAGMLNNYNTVALFPITAHTANINPTWSLRPDNSRRLEWEDIVIGVGGAFGWANEPAAPLALEANVFPRFERDSAEFSGSEINVFIPGNDGLTHSTLTLSFESGHRRNLVLSLIDYIPSGAPDAGGVFVVDSDWIQSVWGLSDYSARGMEAHGSITGQFEQLSTRNIWYFGPSQASIPIHPLRRQ